MEMAGSHPGSACRQQLHSLGRSGVVGPAVGHSQVWPGNSLPSKDGGPQHLQKAQRMSKSET